MSYEKLHGAVLFIPVITTCFAIYFATILLRRYREKGGGKHLLWWGIGMVTYAMGTFTEAFTSIFGWNPVIFKFWYVVGALLGGAPLAQGTVWLLLKRRTAKALTVALVAAVVVSAAFVIASPINYEVVDPNLPSGRAFAWPPG